MHNFYAAFVNLRHTYHIQNKFLLGIKFRNVYISYTPKISTLFPVRETKLPVQKTSAQISFAKYYICKENCIVRIETWIFTDEVPILIFT